MKNITIFRLQPAVEGPRQDQLQVWPGDDLPFVRGRQKAVADEAGYADAELHDQLEPDPVGEMMKRRNINIGDL